MTLEGIKMGDPDRLEFKCEVAKAESVFIKFIILSKVRRHEH